MEKQTTYWLLFCGSRLLLKHDNHRYELPVGQCPSDNVEPAEWRLPDVLAYSCEIAESHPIPEGYCLVGLRESYDVLSAEDYRLAGRIAELHYWNRNTRFCPVCGSRMQRIEAIHKQCPQCRKHLFPAITPAILVLIHRGDDEILLVHARNFKGTFYSLVAGFLEAGETLEECVAREVAEETGLTITDIRYFGSQPWPYPSNLMVGFTARYVSGQVHLQDSELSAGKFYSRHDLPELPRPLSLARRMIDAWLDRQC